MGLFRSKGKVQPNLSDDLQGDYTASSNQSNGEYSHSRNDMSTTMPSHEQNDSTYSNSNIGSNVGSNMSNTDTRVSQQPPRTTVVTTTTTTTTTTTVNSDGSTHTQVHPYDPSTDPPPASETTIINSTQPSNSPHVNHNSENTTVRRNSTSGGRPIPPRSELRNNQNAQPQPYILPLSNHTLSQAASSPTEPSNGAGPLHQSTSINPTQPQDQHPHQSAMYPSQSPLPTNSTTSSDPFSRHGKRESLMTALKGIHGAGEAIRGTVNSKIAGRLGDETDAMNQRMVKEQGLREVRESGIRERTHGGKLRKRSLSREMGGDRRGLERVDETGANF